MPIHVQRIELEDARTQDDYTIREWIDFPGANYVEHDGEAEILPGVRLVPAPGETRGHQIVVVETDEGPVVLGGDVGHSFREIGQADTPGQAARARARRADVPRARRASRTSRGRTSGYSYSSGIRAVSAASTLSWIDGTSCISVRKPDAVRTRIRDGPRVFTVAVRGWPVTRAISPTKSPGPSSLTTRPLRRTSASPWTRTMNSKPPAPSLREIARRRQVELVRERGDLGELALRAALEQRNPLQQLDLRVLAQHRPRYSLLHGPIRCNKARRNDRRRAFAARSGRRTARSRTSAATSSRPRS